MGYIHLPFAEQLSEQGIRFFDFDLIPDRFSGIELDPAVTDHLADDLAICTTWYRCMLELAAWMDANPRHALVVVLVGEAYLFATSRGLHFQLDDLEDMAVTAFDRERILSPADIRGRHPSLRAAIRADGWPTIEETRGKIMFVLNDRTLSRERYIERGGLDADDRFLFLIGDRDDPSRATRSSSPSSRSYPRWRKTETRGTSRPIRPTSSAFGRWPRPAIWCTASATTPR